jgi:hypothetical protein
MKENDTNRKNDDASEDLIGSSSAVLANNKSKYPKKNAKKASNKKKKWGILRHIKQAGWPKRLKWIGITLPIATGIVIALIYISDHIQRSEQFQSTQRPRIVIDWFKIGDTVTQRYELRFAKVVRRFACTESAQEPLLSTARQPHHLTFTYRDFRPLNASTSAPSSANSYSVLSGCG